MESTYGEAYHELYARHWWWRAREAFLVDLIRERRPPGGFGSILDIGCGDGLFFPALSEFGSPSGIETDARLVDDAAPSRDLIHVGTLDTFPSHVAFGLIVMLDVLEHVEDDLSLLRQALALLDGWIIITVPALPVLWTHHDDINRHFRRYRRRQLIGLATHAGVRIDLCHSFYHWTVPAKLAQRMAEKLSPPRPDAVPRIPPAPVNEALYRLSRVEQRAHSLLGRLPGSSLLLIGRK